MKKPAYLLALILFVGCVMIDLLAFLFGQPLAGITLITSTIIVFFAGHIWFVHQPEPKLRIRSLVVLLPLTVIYVGFLKGLNFIKPEPNLVEENLLSQGQVLMSRYQGGLWVLGIVMVCTFILAASILEKGKA